MLVSTPGGVETMWTSSVQREVREGGWNNVRCRGRGSLHGWVRLWANMVWVCGEEGEWGKKY